jgi:hypothetical protein
MGKSRNFAMSLPGPYQTAQFYRNASAMELVGETDSNFAEAGDIAARTRS